MGYLPSKKEEENKIKIKLHKIHPSSQQDAYIREKINPKVNGHLEAWELANVLGEY